MVRKLRQELPGEKRDRTSNQVDLRCSVMANNWILNNLRGTYSCRKAHLDADCYRSDMAHTYDRKSKRSARCDSNAIRGLNYIGKPPESSVIEALPIVCEMFSVDTIY